MQYEVPKLKLPHPETKLIFSDCYGSLSNVKIEKVHSDGYRSIVDGHEIESVMDCHLKLPAGDGVPRVVIEVAVRSFSVDGRAIDVEKNPVTYL